tara:strand:- start:184 stop:495 length:312 start_codon:yes stop_codon:yes gene_type:complete
MGSAPKKIFKALVKKPLKFVDKKVVEPAEKLVKKVTEEVGDTVMGTDKTDRRPNDKPTVSKAPTVSKVEPEKSPTLTYAQGGLSAAEQRKLLEKNKAFKQTKI